MSKKENCHPYVAGTEHGTLSFGKVSAAANEIISCLLESGPDGEFTPNAGKPGVCSITQWICSGSDGGLYESREQYNRDSACANKDPVCGTPPDDRCTTKAFRKSPAGKKKCKAWAKCMGY